MVQTDCHLHVGVKICPHMCPIFSSFSCWRLPRKLIAWHQTQPKILCWAFSLCVSISLFSASFYFSLTPLPSPLIWHSVILTPFFLSPFPSVSCSASTLSPFYLLNAFWSLRIIYQRLKGNSSKNWVRSNCKSCQLSRGGKVRWERRHVIWDCIELSCKVKVMVWVRISTIGSGIWLFNAKLAVLFG